LPAQQAKLRSDIHGLDRSHWVFLKQDGDDPVLWHRLVLAKR
jgi:hypothetical protein